MNYKNTNVIKINIDDIKFNNLYIQNLKHIKLNNGKKFKFIKPKFVKSSGFTNIDQLKQNVLEKHKNEQLDSLLYINSTSNKYYNFKQIIDTNLLDEDLKEKNKK